MPKLLRIMYLIFALGFVIFFHELGHFASCKFFNIRTPVFSLGFGPALIKKQIGQTTFQISLLPLGGYVSINSADLQKASYTQKMIITLAGIFNNFLLSWFLLCMLFLLDYRRLFPALAQGTKTVMELIRKSFATIFGLLGKKSASQGQLSAFSIFHHDLQGFSFFLFFIATISIELGAFNVLPIPLLDGGQAMEYTLEAASSALFGSINYPFIHYIYIILLIVMILLLNRRK